MPKRFSFVTSLPRTATEPDDRRQLAITLRAEAMNLARTTPEAARRMPGSRIPVYHRAPGPDGGLYYDAHPIAQMRYHLTMLAYDMNGEPLSYGHGAPLRLRNEIQHGFKQIKWIAGIEFVAHFSEVAGGHGGYNADHEFSVISTRSEPCAAC